MSHLSAMSTASLHRWIRLIPIDRYENPHSCIRLDRTVELHGRTALLDNFSVLTMKTSFLVFLHSSNFFLEPEDWLDDLFETWHHYRTSS